ncbi:Sirtuin type 2 [Giardia duodenalis]|uniref:Sirtuin type 2 n=1 Tax=Giardia intestinalis (strain ATCC 50803 / WB clone C6) TaxID=184922 RepID=A8B7M7_GIAIC|nr:Sirtuin type 2 [Giardia intestinalis]KAE8305427.1 Sirtuin type 2 [Giardia intestinalis]|eukprot:XP_001708841.1 Sirtuin type 2 [Giardia lamblia ATCC 50803]
MQIEEDRRLEERRSKEKGLGKVLSKVFTLQRAEIRQLKPPFLESFSLESENSFLNYKIDLLYAALFPGEGAPKPKAYCILGAGVSTAVGLSAFRSSGSIFRRVQHFYPLLVYALQQEVADPSDDDFFLRYALGLRGIIQNPIVVYSVLREYHESIMFISNIRPSLTHYFLRFLADEGILKLILTQNIDELERGVGLSEVVDVKQVHGSLSNPGACLACGRSCLPEVVLQAIRDGSVAACENCGSAIKPGIVCYDEDIDLQSDTVNSLSDRVNPYTLGLVFGTSLLVEPVKFLPGAAPLSSQIHIVCRAFDEAAWLDNQDLQQIKTARLKQHTVNLAIEERNTQLSFSPYLNIIDETCDAVVQALLCRNKVVAEKFLATMRRVLEEEKQNTSTVTTIPPSQIGPFHKVYLAAPELIPPDGYVQCIELNGMLVFCLLTLISDTILTNHFCNQSHYDIIDIPTHTAGVEHSKEHINQHRTLCIIEADYKEALRRGYEATVSFLQNVLYRPINCHWGSYIYGYNAYRLTPPGAEYIETHDPWNALFFCSTPAIKRHDFCYKGMPGLSLHLQNSEDHTLFIYLRTTVSISQPVSRVT